MGYRRIDNLYKDQRILAFREVYALEKIHGSSAHIAWDGGLLQFFSGGIKRERFMDLFGIQLVLERQPSSTLLSRFRETVEPPCTVYGEAYGGNCMRMSPTYGKELRFVVFEVKIGDSWLSVPQAADVAAKLGLEFVHYDLISTDLDSINAARDAPSVQAQRNGCGEDKQREGIVLRPPFEVRLNNGERLIVKHKAEDFRETATPRNVGPDPLVLEGAERIAKEWVTPMRLDHVLDKLPEASGIEHTGTVIRAMVEDVFREGEGEFDATKPVKKAISAEVARMWKAHVTKVRV